VACKKDCWCYTFSTGVEHMTDTTSCRLTA